MIRLTIRLFLLGVFLAGCVKSQSNPVPTPATNIPIPSTATSLPSLTVAPTPTINPTATVQEIKVSSNNNGTYLDGFVDHVNSLAWSGDGKTLIIASQQNYLVYFDVQSKQVTIDPVGDSIISSIALSPDKKTLAVNSASSLADNIFVRFINLETGEIFTTIKVEKTPIFDGQARVVYGGTGIFALDGKAFILNSSKQITLWDVASGNQIKELFRCDPDFFTSGLFFNPAKSLLFTIYFKQFEWEKEKTYLRWDTNTWKLTKTLTGDFSGFSFSPDGNTFVPRGKETYILDSDTLTELLTFTDSRNLGLYRGDVIAYDPSGNYVAVSYRTASPGSHVNIYNARTGKLIRQLEGRIWGLEVLAFSPDGTKLAAGGGYERPGALMIWDLSQP